MAISLFFLGDLHHEQARGKGQRIEETHTMACEIGVLKLRC